MTRATPKTGEDGAESEVQVAHIGTAQLRALHGLLRAHGIDTDDGIYTYLSEATGRDITSRKQITAVEAGHILAELEAAPLPVRPMPEVLSALRAPFPEQAIGQLPRSTCRDCRESQNKRCPRHEWISNCSLCRTSHSTGTMHITFVGHADVTDRLLSADPEWTYRVWTNEELMGIPPEMRKGLWIWLTVGGVTRPGFGDSENGKGAKEAIGDALRNAAMRFGVALDLWAKGDREWASSEKTGAETEPMDPPAPRQQQSDPPAAQAPPPAPPIQDDLTNQSVADLILLIDSYAAAANKNFDEYTAKWRAAHGNATVEAMHDAPHDAIVGYVRDIRAWKAAHPDE